MHTHHSNSCGICEKLCRKSDKAIKCNNCLKWYHATCIEIPPDHYNILNSCLFLGVKGLLGLCDTCSKNTSIVNSMVKKEITEQISEELIKTLSGLIKESLTEYQNIHMKPSFIEIMKKQEIKVKDIHQQSTDKSVNTVSTLHEKLEQCSSISEQIDNKKMIIREDRTMW